MKPVSSVLLGEPVWVNPGHSTQSAVILMQGHQTCALPVLEGSLLVGTVTAPRLLGLSAHVPVSEVMEKRVSAIASTASIREAADLLDRERLECLPVMNGSGKLVGTVTAATLLTELRRSHDPLTELSWSDSLREWSIEKLQAGHELTVLFADVNGFGQFNKKYGHVVGDSVLVAVANRLRDLIDQEMDVLCRYGGDEFCIGTLRGAEEASSLAEAMSRRIESLRIPEAEDERITIAVGIRGGKRTREREHVHYAATVNSLINLASKDSMAKKVSGPAQASGSWLQRLSSGLADAEPVREAASQPVRTDSAVVRNGESRPIDSARLKLTRLAVTWSGSVAEVVVELEPRDAKNGASSSRSEAAGGASTPSSHAYCSRVNRETDTSGALLLVAEATTEALRRALAPTVGLDFREVIQSETSDGRRLLTVVGDVRTAGETRPIAGTAFTRDDVYRAVAAAVLDAANRHLPPVVRAPAPVQ
ncbi:MAG TPA: GGDEF domain-containing protein [Chthonomonadales bacterium]|nr:GGDEF domain-containing protein [Chthonomonadales bacterium]